MTSGIWILLSLMVPEVAAGSSCDQLVSSLMKLHSIPGSYTHPPQKDVFTLSSDDFHTAQNNILKAYELTPKENAAVHDFLGSGKSKKEYKKINPNYKNASEKLDSRYRAQDRLLTQYHLGSNTRYHWVVENPDATFKKDLKPFDTFEEIKHGKSIIRIYRKNGDITSILTEGPDRNLDHHYFDIRDCKIHYMAVNGKFTHPKTKKEYTNGYELSAEFCHSLKTLDTFATPEGEESYQLLTAIGKTRSMYSGIALRHEYENAKTFCTTYKDLLKAPTAQKSTEPSVPDSRAKSAN